jgi:peptidoglycan/LPS O-acetylase OafA/YrhL
VPWRFTDVDALRTGLVAGVVVFHGLRVFDPFDFYVKGPELEALVPVVLLGVLVGMPLFFVFAGFGLWHSLGRRSAATVVRERVLRLGVPFVVGVVVLVPPQIHAERLQDGSAGSYWDTLRDFFSVRLVAEIPIPLEGRGDGPFEPAHLWFLAYLLVFSVLLVPLLRPLRGDPARAAAAVRRLAGRAGLAAAVLAVAVVEAVHASEDAGGWSRWTYVLFIAFGCALAVDATLWAALARMRRLTALLAVPAFLVLAVSGALLNDRLGDAFLTGHAPEAMAWRFGQGVTGCLLIAAVLGAMGARRERAALGPLPRWLAWMAAVALPVYVVHQTIGVVWAYVVLGWEPPVTLAVLAIVAGTTVASVAVAELVRRTPLRGALGMPARDRPAAAPAVSRRWAARRRARPSG